MFSSVPIQDPVDGLLSSLPGQEVHGGRRRQGQIRSAHVHTHARNKRLLRQDISCRTMEPGMSRGCAPSAIRMPISCLRYLTRMH
jgi:ribosomal protein S6E (S10)